MAEVSKRHRSSGIWAVGGLADTATTHAASGAIERADFIFLNEAVIAKQKKQIYHRSSSGGCIPSPRPLVTLRFRHRLMLVFAYAADAEFRVSILPRGSRRADESGWY